MTEAARKATDGSAADAEKLRGGAGASLRTASEAFDALNLPPPGPPDALGEALREVERTVRKSIAELSPKGNAMIAEKAARDAARVLREIADRVRNGE